MVVVAGGEEPSRTEDLITTIYVGDQDQHGRNLIELAAGWSSRHCQDYSAPGARSSFDMATGQSPPNNQNRPCSQRCCKAAQAC